jgi:tetratricopeptide (TPR) repeat protein
LAKYEDRELEAKARGLLGRTLLAMGESTQAIQHLAASQTWYQAEGKWAEATRLIEHLEVWGRTREIIEPVQTQVRSLITKLQKRQYVGIFQHRLPVCFRRLALLLLPVILVIAQALTVTVQTSSSLAPEIRFRPAPLLNPEQVVTPGLTLGVTAAQITVLDDTKVVWVWAITLILGYLFISLLLGLGIILFTQLHTVQARGQGATVSFDNHAITLGKGATAQTMQWTEVARFIKADVRLWSRPTRNDSAFGLGTPRDQLVIGGDTSRYAHIRERVAQLVTPATQIVDRDCTILRSKMGILFTLSLIVIGLFDLLAYTSPQMLFQNVFGTIYSLVDLYPYLFLGLIIAPLWWGIVQPLRQRMDLWPQSRLPWWTLGLGLLLTLVQIITRFRPLLTVVNVSLPFITIVILASAGMAVWRAQVSGHNVYPVATRVSIAIVVLLTCGLMTSVLWRDTSAYNYLVAGHTLRDQALQDNIAVRKEFLLGKALEAYENAAEIGSRKVWGIDTKSAAKMLLGIPAPDSFTWLSAISNQAALQVQLGENEMARQNYTTALSYTNQPGLVYAERALTLQSLATAAGEQGGLTIDRLQYEEAIDSFNEAIRLGPNNASCYLWRGVAQQALGQFDEALRSYDSALAIKCDSKNSATCLTLNQRAHVLTGQGWIMYQHEDYTQALDSFWQAKQAAPQSAEVWLGEGYTLYALGLYEDVLPVWETAAELDPKDATILISLGTLHWKFGGKSEELGRDRCEEYRLSLDLFTRATDRDKLHRQFDKDVAYTYRTRGQVLYLLEGCPGYDRVEALKQAVDSYSEAIRLNPGNAFYWHMRGRLSYLVWSSLQEQPSHLTIFIHRLAGMVQVRLTL